MDRSAGAAPVVVTTTINAHLQSFLGVVLSETLAEQRAAVAMGIVIDVASGEIRSEKGCSLGMAHSVLTSRPTAELALDK